MIKGERITLRAIEREDLDRYVAWFNEPEVLHHLALYLPINHDDEVEWYEAQRNDATTQNFAIVLKQEYRHIGSIGLMRINHREQNAELGIAIGDKTQWGQGYGQEAIELLLKYSFEEMNLHRIFLLVNATNTRGIRCYEKCGFVKEGQLRDAVYHNGRFEDQLIMSVLRSEYLK
jgi:RimJ/RimL family protein N-acetyltransferase